MTSKARKGSRDNKVDRDRAALSSSSMLMKYSSSSFVAEASLVAVVEMVNSTSNLISEVKVEIL